MRNAISRAYVDVDDEDHNHHHFYCGRHHHHRHHHHYHCRRNYHDNHHVSSGHCEQILYQIILKISDDSRLLFSSFSHKSPSGL